MRSTVALIPTGNPRVLEVAEAQRPRQEYVRIQCVVADAEIRSNDQTDGGTEKKEIL